MTIRSLGGGGKNQEPEEEESGSGQVTGLCCMNNQDDNQTMNQSLWESIHSLLNFSARASALLLSLFLCPIPAS